MSTYSVTRKSDGAEIYRYAAETAIEWTGMEFATHDHTAVPEAPADVPAPSGPRRLTKLQFIDRLGDAAFAAILAMAKASIEVEAFVMRFQLATPEQDGTSIDLDDPRTVAGVTAIGGALQAQGVVGEGWAGGVLNG